MQQLPPSLPSWLPTIRPGLASQFLAQSRLSQQWALTVPELLLESLGHETDIPVQFQTPQIGKHPLSHPMLHGDPLAAWPGPSDRRTSTQLSYAAWPGPPLAWHPEMGLPLPNQTSPALWAALTPQRYEARSILTQTLGPGSLAPHFSLACSHNPCPG